MPRQILLLIALALAGCATPPPAPRGIDPQILGELRGEPEVKPQPRPEPVDQALLPPLRMEMPSVRGQPIDPKFDLSVNNAPASQVFLSIVSGTRYSMLVHPSVSGNVTVNLKDVTIEEALQSLRDLYGYDYRIDGNRIFVQPAGLQSRVYQVNYLTGQRRGSTEVRVQSGAISDSGGGGSAAPTAPGTPAPTGGQVSRSLESSRVTTQQQSDFWAELRTALTALVGNGEGRSIVVSPQSGIVVVRAMPQELRSVDEYLKATRLAVERQVMLEAKIIEVTLSDAYQSGINWSLFRNSGPDIVAGQVGANTQLTSRGGVLAGGGLTTSAAQRAAVSGGSLLGLAASTPAAGMFGLALQTSNFAALLEFLESQGNAQVLSSPRLATLNNQKSILKVGTDEFFVTNVTTTTTTSGTATQQSPSVTVQPFFSGIVLDVTPQIDESGNIILHIHPSVSEVTESTRVVNLGGTIATITLPLAKSTVNETDTIVRVSDGNIVAIGGLMSVDIRDNRGGMPGVSEGGIGGALLRNVNRASRKKELVILLKPTVIQAGAPQDLRETRQRFETLDGGMR